MRMSPLHDDMATTSVMLGVLSIIFTASVVASAYGAMAAIIGLVCALVAQRSSHLAPRLRRRASLGMLLCFIALVTYAVLFAAITSAP
jgi:hypothetical protein